MCRKFFHKMLRINHLRWIWRLVLGGRLGRFSCFCLFLALFCFTICACGRGEPERSPAKNGALVCADSAVFKEMQYAKMFRLGLSCGVNLVEIRSFVGRDTLAKRFVLADSTQLAARGLSLERLGRGREWKNASILPVPLSRAVVLSSAQIGYMSRLGVTDRIVGVGDARFVVDSSLSSRASNPARLEPGASNPAPVTELGNGSALDYEKLLALKPDLVMTFATGGSEDDYARLELLGIPVMLTSEWQEESPLAKAEWIKLYGILFCGVASGRSCEVPADSVFEQSRISYEALRDSIVADSVPKPRVLVGMVYGGVWYAPGGRSYTVELIRDAGGRYLWESDTTREMKLSLEQVLAFSDSADVWINPGVFASMEEILAAEPRVKNVKAFREGRICQNDARKSPGGGNDFYEGAVARPAELLKNVTECLHFDSRAPKRQNLAEPPYKWYRNIYKL